MLRCSNAAALRAQFTIIAARRAPITSPWLRASNAHLRRYKSDTASRLPDFRDPTGLSGSSVFRTKDVDPVPTPAESTESPDTERRSRYSAEDASARQDTRKFKKGTKTKVAKGGEFQGFTRDPLMQIATNEAPRPQRATIEKEMVWLHDPRKLADRVQMLLREKKYSLAVELARQALYREHDSDVAWNHIFKYCLSKNHPKAAFRFWNDFKKRGGTPNEYAYTIMLDGFANAEKRREVDPMRMAQAVYRSMIDPKNPVKTSVIQVNAMLKVCQVHGAMDVLWEIAGSMPEQGPGSPRPDTYTIILNAVRRSIQRDIAALKPNETEKSTYIRIKGIIEAKRLWVDVLYGWRNGAFSMSGRLVSAMAGCLWEGTGDRHLHEVLQLYQQTAGIPVFAEKPLRGSDDVSGRARSQLSVDKSQIEVEEDEVPFVDNKGKTFSPSKRKSSVENLEEEIESLKREEDSFKQLFMPVVAASVKPYKAHAAPTEEEPHNLEQRNREEEQLPVPNYMPVSNRDLSVILTTLLQMTNPVGPGKEYWKHLTKEKTDYKLIPDHRSLISYLRILRVGRTSRACVDLIKNMVDLGQIEQGLPFHISLSTCRRDRKNPNILRNANDLLDLMDYALLIPDYRAISSYLDLVNYLEDNPQDLAMANTISATEALPQKAQTYGRELRLTLRKAAVAALRPHAIRLDDAMNAYMENPQGRGKNRNFALTGVDRELVTLQAAPATEVLNLLTRMRLLVDTILKTEKGKTLPKKEAEAFEEDSRRLRKYSKIETLKHIQDESAKGNRLVFATVEQQLAYRERRGKIQPEATPEPEPGEAASWDK
ncbi:pentatricopeptide repeat-containing protein [Aspergillus stella-maris]|uniref:pentatricopeptide repeat-containing protein n=1 Tax=Aspergillus stella-maris TaxID=1810926 RepID=UPI003CCD5263